jgi:hypothetical protein
MRGELSAMNPPMFEPGGICDELAGDLQVAAVSVKY